MKLNIMAAGGFFIVGFLLQLTPDFDVSIFKSLTSDAFIVVGFGLTLKWVLTQQSAKLDKIIELLMKLLDQQTK